MFVSCEAQCLYMNNSILFSEMVYGINNNSMESCLAYDNSQLCCYCVYIPMQEEITPQLSATKYGHCRYPINVAPICRTHIIVIHV